MFIVEQDKTHYVLIKSFNALMIDHTLRRSRIFFFLVYRFLVYIKFFSIY